MSDVIIYGSGISGASVALRLAERGLSVRLIGPVRVHGSDAEWPVTLSDETATRIHSDLPTSGLMTWIPFGATACWMVRRTLLESWLNDVVATNRVTRHPDAVVDNLLWEDGAVVGCLLESGELLRSRVVVFADGADPRRLAEVGLRPAWTPSQLYHIYRARFGAPGPEPQMREVPFHDEQGRPADGLAAVDESGATLASGYTLEQEMQANQHPRSLIPTLRRHPALADLGLSEDGEGLGTEVVPMAGDARLPRCITDGAMLVGEYAGLSAPMSSDMLGGSAATIDAAEPVLAGAVRAQDGSSVELGRYRERLHEWWENERRAFASESYAQDAGAQAKGNPLRRLLRARSRHG